MSAKSKLSAFGNGLLNAAVIAADLPVMTRMTEIESESEIDRLQKEYAELNEQLDSSRRRAVPYTK